MTDSIGIKGWGSQHWLQFLQADDDVVEIASSRAPNIPHLGGPYVPSVSVANIQSRGKIRPREEEE
eukprot:3439401-Lingulodinium_polyedra.AAC.1